MDAHLRRQHRRERYDRRRWSGWRGRVGQRPSAGSLQDPPVELEALDPDPRGCPCRQLDHVLIVQLAADRGLGDAST